MAEELLEAVSDKFASEQRTLENYTKGIFPDREKHAALFKKVVTDNGCLFFDEVWKQ